MIKKHMNIWSHENKIQILRLLKTGPRMQKLLVEFRSWWNDFYMNIYDSSRDSSLQWKKEKKRKTKLLSIVILQKERMRKFTMCFHMKIYEKQTPLEHNKRIINPELHISYDMIRQVIAASNCFAVLNELRSCEVSK